MSFCQVAFRYFILSGKMEPARVVRDMLGQWDPDHPLISRMLKVLEGSVILRTIQGLVKGRLGR